MVAHVLGLRIIVSEAMQRHSGQLLRQRQSDKTGRCGVSFATCCGSGNLRGSLRLGMRLRACIRDESHVLVSEWPRASHSSSHVGGMSGHTRNSLVVLGCACWWLSLGWLGAVASGGGVLGSGASRWLVGLWMFRYLLRRR